MKEKNDADRVVFIDYLNREIEYLYEESKHPGWTKWVIIVSSASILWVLLSEIEKNTFDITHICVQLLLLFLGYSLVSDIYYLSKPKDSRKRPYFYSIENIYKSNLLGILLKGSKYLIIIALIVYISNIVGISPLVLALLRYAISFILLVVIFPLIKIFTLKTNMKAFIPDNINFKLDNVGKVNKGIKIFIYIVNNSPIISAVVEIIIDIYIIVFYAYHYLVTIGIKTDPMAIANIKIAFLSFSIFILLYLLIDNIETEPSNTELINIRRELMFDNLELSIAKQLAEMAVIGIDKSTLIQMEVSDSINTLKNIEKELILVSKKIKIKRNNWPTFKEEAYTHLQRARNIYLSDKRFQTGFKLMLPIYSMIDPHDIQFRTTLKNFQEIYLDVKRKYDKTILNWLKLIEKYEGKESRIIWERVATLELAAELPKK